MARNNSTQTAEKVITVKHAVDMINRRLKKHTGQRVHMDRVEVKTLLAALKEQAEKVKAAEVLRDAADAALKEADKKITDLTAQMLGMQKAPA